MITTFCAATSTAQALHVLNQLQSQRVRFEDISILHRSIAQDESDPSKKQRFLGRNPTEISGAGLFIISGPIREVMTEVRVGSILGGICGGLIRLGVPEIEAKRYEGKILYGDILFSVQTAESSHAKQVKGIFDHAKATDIYVVDKSRALQIRASAIWEGSDQPLVGMHSI